MKCQRMRFNQCHALDVIAGPTPHFPQSPEMRRATATPLPPTLILGCVERNYFKLARIYAERDARPHQTATPRLDPPDTRHMANVSPRTKSK